MRKKGDIAFGSPSAASTDSIPVSTWRSAFRLLSRWKAKGWFWLWVPIV